TQARDAILQADAFFHGGTNYNELYAAFAKRGLGKSAVANDAGSTTVTEAFDTPPVLSFTVSPSSLAPFTGPPGGGFFTPEALTTELRNLTSSAQDWAVLNVPSWLVLSATNGTIPPHGIVTNVIILSPAAKTLLADQSAA